MKIRIMVVVMALSLIIGITSNASAPKLTDIKGHWAESDISILVSKGIINGKGNGIFDPQGTIKVSEFIKLCVAVLGDTYDTSSYTYWAKPYINRALELGLVYEGQFTNYEKPITREEMSYIAFETHRKIRPIGDGLFTQAPTAGVDDLHLCTSDTYKYSVEKIVLSGIMRGMLNNLFEPLGKSTRAEASVVVLRLIDEDRRKPYIVKDIPSTQVTYGFWDETNGWSTANARLYAPLDNKGRYVSEVMDMYKFFQDNPNSKMGKGALASNSPMIQEFGLGFTTLSYEAYTESTTTGKIQSITMGMSVYYSHFLKGTSPYSITFYKVYDKTYYNTLYKTHGEYLDYIYKALFPTNYKEFEVFLKGVFDRMENKDQVYVDPSSGRKVTAYAGNNGVTVWISDKK